MKAIWKFPLKVRDIQGITMPVGAKILTVHAQHGELVVWAEVDADYEFLEDRDFLIYGTGEKFEHGDDYTYVGTVQMTNAALVWHIYVSN